MVQLEIQLDKNNYLPGKEVSGSLVLEVDKATNIRSLKLHVEDKENTSITVSILISGGSGTPYRISNNSESFVNKLLIDPFLYL